jgi:ketosteroid isomerase-like protein
MSAENVEVIRGIWEAWKRGDIDAVMAVYDRDCVFDTTHYPDWPEAAIRGRDALRRFFSEFLATWESWNPRLETLRDVGDDRVLAVIRQSFRGRGSGVDVEMHWAQICTLRSGMVVHVDNFTDPAEALEAVGHGQRR